MRPAAIAARARSSRAGRRTSSDAFACSAAPRRSSVIRCFTLAFCEQPGGGRSGRSVSRSGVRQRVALRSRHSARDGLREHLMAGGGQGADHRPTPRKNGRFHEQVAVVSRECKQRRGSTRPENFFREFLRCPISDPPFDSDAHAFHFNQTPYSLSSVPCPVHAREGQSGSVHGALFIAICVPMTFSGPWARITRMEKPRFIRLCSMDDISSRGEYSV